MHRTTFRGALAALVLIGASVAGQAHAQNRIIVGYPPGGALDAIARHLTTYFNEATGQSFIVENRAGAAGTIGAAALRGGPTDGSMLLFAPDSNVSVYPHIVAKPTYTPLTDFVAIAHGGDYRISLAVNAGVPAQDLKSFVAWTKSQPGPIGYGTAGAGTNLHFYGALLSQVTGASMNHVSYRGTGPAVVDLVAGHLPAVVLPMGPLLTHVRAGKIRILAQTGEDRSTSLPDVPSFKELGYPALAVSGWYGMFAPAGTSPDIVRRYHDIMARAYRTPEMRARLKSVELDPREMSQAAMQAMVKADTERWGPIIKASGFTPSAQ